MSLRVKKTLDRLWPWFAAALSGALLALCFAPWDQSWLCWTALTPLVCAVWFGPKPARRVGLRAALLGYVAGIVFFTLTFHWLGSLAELFENPWMRGIPALLSLYLALFFAFWAWQLHRLIPDAGPAPFLRSRRNLLTAFLAASGWVAHEWIRGWLFSGFGWDGLGVALHRELPMIQIVDVTGVLGLSFLIAFCNVMAVIIVRRIVAELGPLFLKRVRWEFSITVSMVMLVFAYGVRSLLQRSKPTGTPLRIAAIQPNIPQQEKFDSSPEAEDRIFEKLGALTGLAAAANPELLIWPEAATPRGVYADDVNYRFVMDQAARGDFGLLIGTTDSDLELREDYNIAMLLTERGGECQTYRKSHLVPFGEYMPLRHSFPLFAMVAGELVPSDFAAGTEFTVMQLQTPAVQFAALICFEDTLGDLTRKFVQGGAQLLVNITNDGWFQKSAGSQQHLANAIFRAIENRRPLVRGTNTGMTCSVNPTGHVDQWIPPFEQGFATRTILVPKDAPLTFYTRHGDWIAWLCTAATTGALIVPWLRRRSGRHQETGLE